MKPHQWERMQLLGRDNLEELYINRIIRRMHSRSPEHLKRCEYISYKLMIAIRLLEGREIIK